jgi:hypothetical protein
MFTDTPFLKWHHKKIQQKYQTIKKNNSLFTILEKNQKRQAFAKMKKIRPRPPPIETTLPPIEKKKKVKKQTPRYKFYKKLKKRFYNQGVNIPITIKRWIYDN